MSNRRAYIGPTAAQKQIDYLVSRLQELRAATCDLSAADDVHIADELDALEEPICQLQRFAEKQGKGVGG